VPGVRVQLAPAAAQEADYRVGFAAIQAATGFTPRRTVADGVTEIAGLISRGAVPDYTDPRYSNYKALINGDALAALASSGLPVAAPVSSAIA